jgi:hypothetical protein
VIEDANSAQARATRVQRDGLLGRAAGEQQDKQTNHCAVHGFPPVVNDKGSLLFFGRKSLSALVRESRTGA